MSWLEDTGILPFHCSPENNTSGLIYNTLANNYTSVPTRYKGDIRLGLTVPVKKIVYLIK